MELGCAFPWHNFDDTTWASVHTLTIHFVVSIHPSVRPSVRLSVRPSVRLSVCPPVRLSVCLSICLSLYLSICLSVYLSIYLSVCPSIYLSLCLSLCLCLSVCVSVCRSVRPSIHVSIRTCACQILSTIDAPEMGLSENMIPLNPPLSHHFPPIFPWQSPRIFVG